MDFQFREVFNVKVVNKLAKAIKNNRLEFDLETKLKNDAD